MKKKERSSRNRMKNRIGKRRHKQSAAYAEVPGELAGTVRRVPANRPAKRAELAWVTGRTGRSVRQAARQKRKALLLAQRRRRDKLARDARKVGRV